MWPKDLSYDRNSPYAPILRHLQSIPPQKWQLEKQSDHYENNPGGDYRNIIRFFSCTTEKGAKVQITYHFQDGVIASGPIHSTIISLYVDRELVCQIRGCQNFFMPNERGGRNSIPEFEDLFRPIHMHWDPQIPSAKEGYIKKAQQEATTQRQELEEKARKTLQKL